MNANPRALVTGATGFIGSHLAKTLVEKGWEVTCLVRKTSKTSFLKGLPVALVVGDALDLSSLERAVEGQDYVFHSAGQIRPVRKEKYDIANHQLTRNLFLACLKRTPELKRFVYISSISASGPSPPGCKADENMPCAPNSEYGRSKLRGEEAVQEFWDSAPATIIRPPNVYGPRQQETELLIRAIRRRIVPLLRDEGKVTSLIYIKDLVDGIILAALSPKTVGQIYYLTDGQGYSWRTIMLTIKKSLLGRSPFLPLPESVILFSAWLADMLRKASIANINFGRKFWKAMTKTPFLFSSAKAEEELGFQPRFTLEEGIRETLEYYGR